MYFYFKSFFYIARFLSKRSSVTDFIQMHVTCCTNRDTKEDESDLPAFGMREVDLTPVAFQYLCCTIRSGCEELGHFYIPVKSFLCVLVRHFTFVCVWCVSLQRKLYSSKVVRV